MAKFMAAFLPNLAKVTLPGPARATFSNFLSRPTTPSGCQSVAWTTGLWPDGADGLPFQLQWRLGTVAEDGLVASGDTLIPPGAVYFNARCERREDGLGVRLSDGRITVKEEIGANGLFQARGILAEFKIVGTFECTPPVNLGTSVF